jgi:hypothetical protein
LRRRQLIPVLIVLALGHPPGVSAQGDIDIRWYAFGQLTAERLADEGGLGFGADRLRFNVQAAAAQWSGRVQLDFRVDDLGDHAPGTLPNLVQDLYADYRMSETHALRVGQFKTPLGMDFNVPDSTLDITKRGMETGLALNRAVGVMIAGRRGGLGYDVGIFNPAGRSAAAQHVDSQVGEDNVAAARARYDREHWHAELAYGQSPNAGGPSTADYRVTDFGFRYVRDRWSAKLEWIEGRGVFGVEGFDSRVYYVHGGFRPNPKWELVARHYDGRSALASAATSLTNTYLGATARLFEHERLDVRLQLNYVIAGGDRALYTGVRGYRDDALLIQLQLFTEN